VRVTGDPGNTSLSKIVKLGFSEVRKVAGVTVASVKIIDEEKQRARSEKAARIANAIVGVTAAAYLAKVCYQLRQKPIALLNTNETQMLQPCLANGF
jgi:hypothetical protein